MTAIVVAFVYACARAAAMALAIGLGGAVPSNVVGWLATELISGLVIAITLLPIARWLAPGTRWSVFVFTTLLSLSTLAVLIEGAAFQPTAVPIDSLPASALLQLGVAWLTARVLVSLTRRPESDGPPPWPRQTAWSWAWRYVACAVTYVVLYFVTGALNYLMVTGPYYASHAAGLVVPAPQVVLVVATIEGLLLPLAVVPLLRTLGGTPMRRAFVSGAALFVLGGVVPLLVASTLPVELRVASAVEILFQKLPVGVAAALMLVPAQLRTSPPVPASPRRSARRFARP